MTIIIVSPFVVKLIPNEKCVVRTSLLVAKQGSAIREFCLHVSVVLSDSVARGKRVYTASVVLSDKCCDSFERLRERVLNREVDGDVPCEDVPCEDVPCEDVSGEVDPFVEKKLIRAKISYNPR